MDSENGFLDSENGFLDLENSFLEFGILKLEAKRPQSGEVRGRISAYTHINSEVGNSAAAPPQRPRYQLRQIPGTRSAPSEPLQLELFGEKTCLGMEKRETLLY